MPDRIFAGQRAVACDILHRMLAIAEAHNGLATLRDEDADNDPGAEPPILVYHPEARRLQMPDPEAIVTHHWEAAQHLLDWPSVPSRGCATGAGASTATTACCSALASAG